MRISDWSSDVCSSDLEDLAQAAVDDGVEAGPRRLLAADGLEEQQGVIDAIAREDVHDQPLLVGQQNVLRRRVQVQHALLVVLHVLQQRDLPGQARLADRSEEHTSELQSLMRTSYAVFCLQKQ